MGMPNGRVAIAFALEGTLIDSGGAAPASWRRAFEDLLGVPADVAGHVEAGATDPELARLAFQDVVGRDPSTRELAQLIARRLHYLPETVATAEGYRVLPGVAELLPRLCRDGYLLGVTTGGVEAAAHIELARGELNHFFSFGGYGSDSPDRTEVTRIALERAAIIIGRQLNQSEALIVAAMPQEVEAAKGSGAVAVAVASERFGADELRESGADFVIGSLGDGLPL
jgi:phosphoglycolate phosphatase